MESSGGLDPETIRKSIRRKNRYGEIADHYESYKDALRDNLIVRSGRSPDGILPALIFFAGFSVLTYKASGSFSNAVMDFFEILVLYLLMCLIVSSFYKWKFWSRSKINATCMILLALIIFYVITSPPLLSF